MKKWLMAVIFGTILVLGACGGDSSDEPAGNEGETETTDASEAADIFKENCATCHGDDLSGAAGPNLTEVGVGLTKIKLKKSLKMVKEQCLVNYYQVKIYQRWLNG